MIIHANIIDSSHLYAAGQASGTAVEFTQRGSRRAARSFHVKLSGSSNRLRMDGQENAATYDEWGSFIAFLFALEPRATIGDYADRADFVVKTAGRFERIAPPESAHKAGANHRWVSGEGDNFIQYGTHNYGDGKGLRSSTREWRVLDCAQEGCTAQRRMTVHYEHNGWTPRPVGGRA